MAAFLKTILDRLEKNTPNPESYVPQIAKEAADYNKSQFHKVIASVIGVEVLIAEPWLASEINNFVRKNVGYIKSIPTENLQQIEMIVTQGLRSGISTAEMKKQIIPLIDEKIDQASRRASLIARDQLGSLNGQLTQLRQKELGVERYIWITSQDERVRSLHQARNNKIYSWNDPPSDGHPGEPVRCRCIASPQLDDLINNIS